MLIKSWMLLVEWENALTFNERIDGLSPSSLIPTKSPAFGWFFFGMGIEQPRCGCVWTLSEAALLCEPERYWRRSNASKGIWFAKKEPAQRRSLSFVWARSEAALRCESAFGTGQLAARQKGVHQNYSNFFLENVLQKFVYVQQNEEPKFIPQRSDKMHRKLARSIASAYLFVQATLIATEAKGTECEGCMPSEMQTFVVQPQDLYIDENNILMNVNGNLYPVYSLTKSGDNWLGEVSFGERCAWGHPLCTGKNGCNQCHTKICPLYQPRTSGCKWSKSQGHCSFFYHASSGAARRNPFKLTAQRTMRF